jgi:hypothetical protein
MLKVNPFITKEYREEARELTTTQFQDKPVFNKYLDLLIHPAQELQEVWKDLMQKRSLDTAEGAQLDLLGALVGQPRTLIDANLITFFGFLGDFQADSYGDVNVPGVGSVWWDGISPKKGNVTLNDTLYRILIKAKIAKNTTNATPEELIGFANFMFSTTGSDILDEGGAKFRILIGRPLTREEVGLLRYVNHEASYSSKLFPKPVGVRMDFSSFDYDAFFGFQGVVNAKGYGEITYTHYFDGSDLYDGSIIPREIIKVGEDGKPIGGYWGTIHEDI